MKACKGMEAKRRTFYTPALDASDELHALAAPIGYRNRLPQARIESSDRAVCSDYCISPTHLHIVPRLTNAWSYTSTPQYTFMAWCSVKKHEQFYLYRYLRNVRWRYLDE